jgi:mediator of RNA polymerase II transcription subunit 12
MPNGAVEARPPPRGRPQLFYSTAASNGFDLPIHSFPYQPTANLPVPPRPGAVHPRHAAQQRRILPGGTGVKDAPKLTAPEIVPAPVHLAGGKAADLFPWTGSNAEDTLSESLVKVGVTNKPQIMNETNTARPSLWSNLKNKSGLTTLSTLFVAVLEKRQQNGRLQTPNTFKPPPRLTLRDSTREGWLHDLANPTVSLRRLSRTIPHGLTGKVLLEQCLNKNIPLPRALWLAKCVGINELRAHKRKGQAGTVTWGRGWTSSVEQFLDSVISTIGQGDWKTRITYAYEALYVYVIDTG